MLNHIIYCTFAIYIYIFFKQRQITGFYPKIIFKVSLNSLHFTCLTTLSSTFFITKVNKLTIYKVSHKKAHVPKWIKSIRD